MKRFFGYCCVLVLAAGCSQIHSFDGGVGTQGGSSNSIGKRALVSPPDTSGVSVLVRQAPSGDNGGSPPQPNEKVADNFKIEMGERAVEVEGICSLTEENLACWKPTGERDTGLEASFTKLINSRQDNYSQNFEFRFGKKNRILLLKSTIQPFKAGKSRGLGYGLMYERYNGSEFKEGWRNSGGYWGESNQTADQVRTERQVLIGSFDRDTATFPLRYQFTENMPDRKSLPAAKGRFTVDGNTYEILYIADKPNQNGTFSTFFHGSPGQKPPANTYVKIKIVAITNPNSLLVLQPASPDGKPYLGFNDKGEPLDAVAWNKYQIESQRRAMEEQRRGGGGFGGRNSFMNFIQPISVDPTASYSDGVYSFSVNLAISKFRNFSASTNKRTVFVFDKIQLDPTKP